MTFVAHAEMMTLQTFLLDLWDFLAVYRAVLTLLSIEYRKVAAVGDQLSSDSNVRLQLGFDSVVEVVQ